MEGGGGGVTEQYPISPNDTCGREVVIGNDLYSAQGPPLYWSQIIESTAYCNQKLLALISLNSAQNTSDN